MSQLKKGKRDFNELIKAIILHYVIIMKLLTYSYFKYIYDLLKIL